MEPVLIFNALILTGMKRHIKCLQEIKAKKLIKQTVRCEKWIIYVGVKILLGFLETYKEIGSI